MIVSGPVTMRAFGRSGHRPPGIFSHAVEHDWSIHTSVGKSSHDNKRWGWAIISDSFGTSLPMYMSHLDLGLSYLEVSTVGIRLTITFMTNLSISSLTFHLLSHNSKIFFFRLQNPTGDLRC